MVKKKSGFSQPALNRGEHIAETFHHWFVHLLGNVFENLLMYLDESFLQPTRNQQTLFCQADNDAPPVLKVNCPPQKPSLFQAIENPRQPTAAELDTLHEFFDMEVFFPFERTKYAKLRRGQLKLPRKPGFFFLTSREKSECKIAKLRSDFILCCIFGRFCHKQYLR